MLESLDAAAARHWAVVARAVFASRRAGIDALNVYPVPDGDTGTNLFLTFDGALDAAREQRHERAEGSGYAEPTLASEAGALASEMLLTARGNSGVILSELMRGVADTFAADGSPTAGSRLFAQALAEAARLARASVTHPVEGTILTVADAGAAAARTAAEAGGLADVTGAATEAARAALAATTEQLPALARAGVVDAGGAGYLLLIEALDRVVRGESPSGTFAVDAFLTGQHRRIGDTEGGAGIPAVDGESTAPRATMSPEEDHDGTPGGPAFEVMYLLRNSDDERVATLRTTLDGLGDSLLVVGGPDLWNIHVHVDNVGAAIEAGIEAGTPHRIAVTHFADQVGLRRAEPVDVGVVACAAGPGLASLFEAAGAHTVPSGPGRRASAGQILEAARAVHALAVIVLPNDADTQLAAQAAAAAAHQEGIELYVIGSRTAVQGLAALAVFEPTAPAAQNVVAMTSAAAATRHGAVTIASREALTSGGWCHPGDVLGVVNGDIVIVGSDLDAVALEVVTRLLSSGGELLSIVSGQDAPPGLASGLEKALRRERRDVEVHQIYGGQPHYPLLLGVE